MLLYKSNKRFWFSLDFRFLLFLYLILLHCKTCVLEKFQNTSYIFYIPICCKSNSRLNGIMKYYHEIIVKAL